MFKDIASRFTTRDVSIYNWLIVAAKLDLAIQPHPANLSLEGAFCDSVHRLGSQSVALAHR